MMADPLHQAIEAARARQYAATAAQSHVVYLSPQGKPLTDSKVCQLATLPSLILLAGRYEG